MFQYVSTISWSTILLIGMVVLQVVIDGDNEVLIIPLHSLPSLEEDT